MVVVAFQSRAKKHIMNAEVQVMVSNVVDLKNVRPKSMFKIQRNV